MRQIRIFCFGIILSGLLLAGCGKNPDYSYDTARIDALVSSVPAERTRAIAFAKELCVITGDELNPDPLVNAEAAATFSLYDGTVIFQKNPFERMNPASITKVMTVLIAIRDGNLSDFVTVGDETVITEPGATLCHIKPGDTLTLEQLLYGLMLPSGNDAGAAIAVHMRGSVEAFAEEMNRTAHAIGATGTHFVNPHGLTDEMHYTTAYDLYLIFNEALKYPQFQNIIQTVRYTANYTAADGTLKSQEWKNSNQYLTGQVPTPSGITVMGGKTGTTQAAGSCLIIGSRDASGHEYVSVVLKADNRTNLYHNMTKIIQKTVN